jgi:amino acid adenylation domain-containing protein
MVIFQKEDLSINNLIDIEIEPYNFNYDFSRFDISFHFMESDSLKVEINYNSDIYNKTTIQNLIKHLNKLISDTSLFIDSKLSEISIFADEEKNEMQIIKSRISPYKFNTSIPELFSKVARNNSNKIAVRTANEEISYQELDLKSNKFANYLIINYQVGCSERIAVITSREIDWIIILLGILKAGCIYVPFDVNTPKKRIANLVNSSNINKIITNLDGFIENIEFIKIDNYENCSPDMLENRISYNSPAYMIFTSGSTGISKGVLLNHFGFVNMSLAQIDGFGINEDDVIMQYASQSFDASLSEIFMALFSSATLYIIDDNQKAIPEKFIDTIKNHSITVATIPPVFSPFLIEGDISLLRIIISAGDSPNMEAIQYFTGFADVYNAYGPTETSVCASFHKISISDIDSGIIPVGKPIYNTMMYVMNDELNLLPKGSIGELCISGVGLALGYINEDLNKEKFQYSEDISGIVYRTGDLGKIDENNDFVFMGRKDKQFKLRGFRIDPEEIEKYIESIDGISQVEIILLDENYQKEILAYYTSNSIQSDQLKEKVKQLLPGYMIPADFIKVNKFPMTINGKVDTEELKKMKESKDHKPNEQSTLLEEILTELFKEVLNMNFVGLLDNFFEIGGNSISAIILTNKIKQKTGLNINVNDIYFYKNIKDIALKLKNYTNEYLYIQFGKIGLKPIFAFPSILANPFEFSNLSDELKDSSIFAFTIDKQSNIKNYVETIMSVSKDACPIIIGYSLGGILAYMVAIELEELGIIPNKIVVIDSQIIYDNFILTNKELLITQLIDIIPYKTDRNEIEYNIMNYIKLLKNIEFDRKLKTDIHVILSEEKWENDSRTKWQELSLNKVFFHKGIGKHFDILTRPSVTSNALLISHILEIVKKNDYI